MRAVQITAFGGPEVLSVAEVPEPVAGEGQELVVVTAAGVDPLDAAQAAGTAPGAGALPFVPGLEVAGTTGDGRRVVAMVAGGGYAEAVAATSARVFEVPDGVGDDQALALLVAGATAWHLLRTCADVRAQESVVVHAAGDPVGTVAVQLARRWGAARVVAVASTPAERELALALGADVAVDAEGLGADEVAAALREANGGRPVDVVLDPVGGAVTDGSLAALAPFGRLAVHGSAPRAAATPLDPAALAEGSRTVLGFGLAQAGALRQGLGPALEELFSLTALGLLRPVVGGHYPLERAERAHLDLRGPGTSGKLVLDLT